MKINRVKFSEDEFLMSYTPERKLKRTDREGKYQRQQGCRKGTGAYNRPQIEHESRMKRKLIKKAPFILALNGSHSECVVTVLLGWRAGASSGHCTLTEPQNWRKDGKEKKVQRKIVRVTRCRGKYIKY